MSILVTRGAGVIGSNSVVGGLATGHAPMINIDKLTYADNLENLQFLAGDDWPVFRQADIGGYDAVLHLLGQYRVRAVVNSAAEIHVGRSSHGPENFIQTNILDTFRLPEAVQAYWSTLPQQEKLDFRFLQVSADEVYGALSPAVPPVHASSRYAPKNPYSASKAAGDHCVRAYHHTYSLPVLTTNRPNNDGPCPFPEKLMPLCILNALANRPVPLYGNGQQAHDWRYIKGQCSPVRRVLAAGMPGETYNIGGGDEKGNHAVMTSLCALLDQPRSKAGRKSYLAQLTFITGRPGHGRRYAIHAGKLERELGWSPKESFESGMRKTVAWYLDNGDWVANVTGRTYRQWVDQHYGETV